MECCGEIVKKVEEEFVVIGVDGEYRSFYEGPRSGDPECLPFVVRIVETVFCEKCGKVLKWNVIGMCKKKGGNLYICKYFALIFYLSHLVFISWSMLSYKSVYLY